MYRGSSSFLESSFIIFNVGVILISILSAVFPLISALKEKSKFRILTAVMIIPTLLLQMLGIISYGVLAKSNILADTSEKYNKKNKIFTLIFFGNGVCILIHAISR